MKSGDEVGVLVLGGVLLVKFVVASAEDVDVLGCEDLPGIDAFWIGGIVQAAAFDAITCVDEEEVGAIGVGTGAEVVREGDVVAPVGAVGGSRKGD